MTSVLIPKLAYDLSVPVSVVSDMAREATQRGVDVGYVPGRGAIRGSVDLERFMRYRDARIQPMPMFPDDGEDHAFVNTEFGNEALRRIAKVAVEPAATDDEVAARQSKAVKALDFVISRSGDLSIAQAATAEALRALWTGCGGRTFGDVDLKIESSPTPLLVTCTRSPVLSIVGSPAYSTEMA